ncbi:MAG TPA: hypothetical protein GX699_10070 [Firmicutes bacterium]|nr:hypothetical protein [Bacillota bacterium]
MKRKSKFTVFILSFIPGLSHLYLGFFHRGYIFLGAAAALVIVTVGLSAILYGAELFVVLLGLPVLWFVALVDSMTLAERINSGREQEPAGYHPEQGGNPDGIKMDVQNRKILTCILSIVPGAGHMYLGYQKLGLELMTVFFFCLFLIDWLRIGFFMFVIPVIWFYSMFDALHKVAQQPGEEAAFSLFALWLQNKKSWSSSKLLGYVLVGLGLLLIFDRIISPLIPYEIRNYLQTGIVALLLIAGGIRILTGPGSHRNGEVTDKCADGE